LIIRFTVVVIVVLRVRSQRAALTLHTLPLHMRIRTSDGVGNRTIDSRIVFASVVVVVVIAVVALVVGGGRRALTLSLPLKFGGSSSYRRRRSATC